MLPYRVLALALMFVIGSGCAVSSTQKDRSAREQTPYERKAKTHAEVDRTVVASPLGHFLLIRKGAAGCAVRFTSFHRDYDEKAATRFQSGQENVYAEYDWYYQDDGSFDFTKANVTSGHSKLHDGPSVGIGRMAFKIGLKYWIDCGQFTLVWNYPARLSFASHADEKFDRTVELAPTRWTRTEEVEFKEPKLLWIRFLDKQIETWIPLAELP